MSGRSVGTILACALLFSAVGGRSAAALPPGFVDQLVVSGLSGPTAIAVAPDGRQFVTEQKGAVRVVRDRKLLAAPFVRLNVEFGRRAWAARDRLASGVRDQPLHLRLPYGSGFAAAQSGHPVHRRRKRGAAGQREGDPGPGSVVSRTNHNGGGPPFRPGRQTLCRGRREWGVVERPVAEQSPRQNPPPQSGWLDPCQQSRRVSRDRRPEPGCQSCNLGRRSAQSLHLRL